VPTIRAPAKNMKRQIDLGRRAFYLRAFGMKVKQQVAAKVRFAKSDLQGQFARSKFECVKPGLGALYYLKRLSNRLKKS
jgi:hypothetical protein